MRREEGETVINLGKLINYLIKIMLLKDLCDCVSHTHYVTIYILIVQ